MILRGSATFSFILATILATAPCHAGGGHDHHHDGHEESEHSDEPRKGPHGGTLLSHDDVGIEVTIFETGSPPRFRVYPYLRNSLLNPKDVTVTIALRRFGDRIDTFELTPENDYLSSSKVVEEPHSFEVSVSAMHAEKKYEWHYDSFEGRTELSSEALRLANIEIEAAGPANISNSARVYGRLLANEDKVAHIGARFPGIIREIRKSLGDRVEKGEVLAIVESNQNLQLYEIRSLISGVVLQRHATLGENISDSEPLYVIADLSQVWADFQVYRDDIGAIVIGQKIRVELGDGRTPIAATVSYVSPTADETTQSKMIRAVLPNETGELRPGLFVSGVLTASETPVKIAVKRDALQTFRDWNVVYRTDGHVFQATPVELGRKDHQYVEVLTGLNLGDRYVTKNSFIIKADVEKSGASHDH